MDKSSKSHHAAMSAATPKTQAKEPIQLDIFLVCRKATRSNQALPTETMQ